MGNLCRQIYSKTDAQNKKPAGHITDYALLTDGLMEEINEGDGAIKQIEGCGTLFVGGSTPTPVKAVFQGSTQVFPPIIKIEPCNLQGIDNNPTVLQIECANNSIGMVSEQATGNTGTTYEKVWLFKNALQITYKVGPNGSNNTIYVPDVVPTSQTTSKYAYMVNNTIRIKDPRLPYNWPTQTTTQYSGSFPANTIYSATISLNNGSGTALASLKSTYSTTYYPIAYNYNNGSTIILRRQAASVGSGMSVSTTSSGSGSYKIYELYYNGSKLTTNSTAITLSVVNPTSPSNHYNNPETFNSSYQVNSGNNSIIDGGRPMTSTGNTYITNVFLISVPNYNYGTSNSNAVWHNNAISNLRQYTPTNTPNITDNYTISTSGTRIGQNILMYGGQTSFPNTNATFGPFAIQMNNLNADNFPILNLKFNGFSQGDVITAYSGEVILPSSQLLAQGDITNVSWTTNGSGNKTSYLLNLTEKSLTAYSYNPANSGNKTSYSYFYLAADIVGFYYEADSNSTKVRVNTTRVIDTTMICAKVVDVAGTTNYTTTIS